MQNLLIIGAGDAGKMVVQEILENEKIYKKYHLIGILDDDIGKKNVLGFPVLGKIDSASLIVNNNKIDEVIIAIPSADRQVINRIITSLSGTSVKTKIVPGIFEIIEGKVTFNQIRNIEPTDLLGREEVGFNIDSLVQYYNNKTVFVTGAGGSIGSEIFIQLLELPVKKIVAYGHGENSIHSLIRKVSNDNRFSYVIGDIRDDKKMLFEMQRFKPDIVFHAAAHKHVPLMEDYPDESVKNNIIGTYNCAICSIQARVGKFMLISTDKAVNPTSIMGATKRIAERIILSLGAAQEKTKFALTRFGNVLGSRGSVIHVFTDQIAAGGPITVTHPEIERYFMSIREAARLVIKSASIDDGRIFVLDMGKPIKIIDLAKELIRLYGYNEDEIPVIFTGLRKGEKMYEEILTDNEKLSKTDFEKLFISHESEDILNKETLNRIIEEFKAAAESCRIIEIKELIKKYVPEFNNCGS